MLEKTQQLIQIQQNEDINNIDETKRLDEEINALLEQDDLKCRQREKKTWYQLGDNYTKYFHLCATERKEE